ncbi:unnamed protein product [Durusdinium trenchii]|uniref:Uncharacterized protein n=1 Tax=Durusdinium trenchii TaxID=1381693 RepID=A0ABP0L8J7_9DINO
MWQAQTPCGGSSAASTPVEPQEREKKDKKDKKEKKDKKDKDKKSKKEKKQDRRTPTPESTRLPSPFIPPLECPGASSPSIQSVDTGNIYHKYALNAEALAALNRKATADLLAEGLGPAEVADGTVGEVVELSDHVKKLRHAHLNKFGRSLKSKSTPAEIKVLARNIRAGQGHTGYNSHLHHSMNHAFKCLFHFCG